MIKKIALYMSSIAMLSSVSASEQHCLRRPPVANTSTLVCVRTATQDVTLSREGSLLFLLHTPRHMLNRISQEHHHASSSLPSVCKNFNGVWETKTPEYFGSNLLFQTPKALEQYIKQLRQLSQQAAEIKKKQKKQRMRWQPQAQKPAYSHHNRRSLRSKGNLYQPR